MCGDCTIGVVEPRRPHLLLSVTRPTSLLLCSILLLLVSKKIGVNYCIVRPTGLNDKWPAGSRPLFSQGDVAVGRINRQDVAKVLVDVLGTPEACDKTF